MPGAGPIVLFDKSSLQIQTTDEAVWFDTFYFPSITPLFFVETLADLEKEMQSGSSPEEYVGALAGKTPLGGGINVHHHALCLNELLGNRFDLRHVPVVAGGSPVATRDGGRAVVFDPPPEAQALSRWEEGKFLEVERGFAKSWRDALSAIDLDAIFRHQANRSPQGSPGCKGCSRRAFAETIISICVRCSGGTEARGCGAENLREVGVSRKTADQRGCSIHGPRDDSRFTLLPGFGCRFDRAGTTEQQGRHRLFVLSSVLHDLHLARQAS
jgi:hypothetical protein